MRAVKGRLITPNLTLAVLQAEENTPARVFICRLKRKQSIAQWLSGWEHRGSQVGITFLQESYLLSHAEERKSSTWNVNISCNKKKNSPQSFCLWFTSLRLRKSF